MEIAADNAKEMADQGASTSVTPVVTATKVTRDPTNGRSPHVGKKETTEKCYRCLNKHSASSCRFKTATCHKCHKQGHIERACQWAQSHCVEAHEPQQQPDEYSDSDETYTVLTMRQRKGGTVGSRRDN